MQVRPAAGANKKPSPAFQKAYMLLMGAMERRGVFALVSYCLRGKPRVAALTSDGFLRQLAYDDEVRESLPMPTVDLSDAELAMAEKLVKSMSVKKAPAVVDEGSERVRVYAETKAATGAAPEVASKAGLDAGEDLMKALEASLAAAQAS